MIGIELSKVRDALKYFYSRKRKSPIWFCLNMAFEILEQAQTHFFLLITLISVKWSHYRPFQSFCSPRAIPFMPGAAKVCPGGLGGQRPPGGLPRRHRRFSGSQYERLEVFLSIKSNFSFWNTLLLEIWPFKNQREVLVNIGLFASFPHHKG